MVVLIRNIIVYWASLGHKKKYSGAHYKPDNRARHQPSPDLVVTLAMSSSTAEPLAAALKDPARPSFLFGCTPPREGTDDDKAREACAKFTARSSALATDGFIVYDIQVGKVWLIPTYSRYSLITEFTHFHVLQDESSRTPLERPFPFRKTMDPAKYASLFPGLCGKQCVVYKCVAEDSETEFCEWLSRAKNEYAHCAFNLVGAASTDPSPKPDRLSLSGAGRIIANEVPIS